MRRNDPILDCIAWHELARPEPTTEDQSVQLGCHLEEVGEMLEVIRYAEPHLYAGRQLPVYNIEYFADVLKEAYTPLSIEDRAKFADALADQIVTAIGVAHVYGIDIYKAFKRVNDSNWSKFEDGKPVFDENGKIKKGKHYQPANLSDL